MFAPRAFRAADGGLRTALERAVTADDYAELARYGADGARDPRIQDAFAELAWSGSWYEADVAVDQLDKADADPRLVTETRRHLERFRRIGHDLLVRPARNVPLRLVLDICVKPEYLRAHVVAAVRDVLSARVLPDGRRGFFHPDRLMFAGVVAVSQIVAEVMGVEGVAEVHVARLERLDSESVMNLDFDRGLLVLSADEIPRLDGDPAAPDNGILGFGQVRGGR